MGYRTNRKIQFQKNLGPLADEDAELEQIAKDLDLYSEAQEAEVRLKAKGIHVAEREYREEARQFVDELQTELKKTALDKQEKRKQLYQKLGKIGAITAISAAALAMVGVPVYITAKYWNTRDEALQALAKYDKPVKIENLEEREEVISQLDEIIEEHTFDYFGSDEAAARYLKNLESKDYAIGYGAKMLDFFGSQENYERPYGLQSSTLEYLDFLTTSKITPRKGACYLKLGKTMGGGTQIENLKLLHEEGYCKE